ncbi:MAG: DUF1064 domain-containing protein [Betaproteobacteria bacterium]
MSLSFTKRSRFAKHARRKHGERNKTEAEYEAYLTALYHAGQIDGFKFEGITLKLADNTRFTPDFIVFAADGVVELHDTKGTTKKTRSNGEKEAVPWIEEDANIKLKVCADQWPFRVFAVFKTKEGWQRKAF